MNARANNSIIFDLDGTLIDSLPGIEFSMREAFATLDLPMRRTDIRELIGPPIRTILARVGAIDDAQNLDKLESAFRTSYDSLGWCQTACFPGVEAALRMMRAREWRLFIVTNKPEKIALQILEHLRILHYFESVLTRDSHPGAVFGKHDMVRALMETDCIEPESCILAGDTMEDARAAAKAGIEFAHMTYGYGRIDEDASVPVAHRLGSFEELLPLLTKELVHD
jgi:phosphoglycolate phosphatase